MNILNNLRKPYLGVLLSSLILFTSCNPSESINDTNIKSFNYDTYNSYKSIEYTVNISSEDINEPESRKKYSNIVNNINNHLGSSINLTKIDDSLIENYKNKGFNNDDYLNTLLNENDKYLINKFENDLENFNVDIALVNLEKNVISLNISNEEFEKYNKFANIIKLIENQEPGFFNNATKKSYYGKSPCSEAIISYTIATLGLASCGSVVILCGVAIANKIRTFRNMINACQQQ